MLGSFRFLLALMVVVQHLLSIPHLGHFAVHGFFILSGFLMTLIMHKSYGYTLSGVRGFVINRFLRLFPTYWFYLILTLLFILFVGEDFSIQYRYFIYFPNSLAEWLQNATMLFISTFPGTVEPRLLPATWALTVELLFYFFIAIGASKSRKISIVWLIISLGYYSYTIAFNLGYEYRYNFFFAGSLPFSIGAVIFHYHENFKKYELENRVVSLFVLFLINIIVLLLLDLLEAFEDCLGLFYVLNYVISSLIIISLFNVKLGGKERIKIDKFLGDLSYPIYLSHWSVGMIVSYLLFLNPSQGRSAENLIVFIVTVFVSCVLGWFSSTFIDKKVEKVRGSFRKLG
ncbi:acyltransferase family protein [Pseudoalteromonas peptidolytica]|uniref:Acyltransferase 3 domain-containing protein n=1 Tax=Pseudoalteromonas peptidolytica F12-50-A1 TaxID=1315280 RepID=A0A8I0T4D8_9GAMM|nr:acyltransferase [Pseudoalteromonas peptidolytica]MBE0347311.1 hypothetical protein [Pseudoalteromonas peptidolytica F12-50-A1]NLR13944.1 acyltransferase [Pseudoalteromonas peptidolytica]GEK09924.1 hypothetical protein PPE03_21730 [Pseudoalteromonas peptidolytica]